MQEQTLIFDQVHLGVPSPEDAARWYVQYLGAAPGDHLDRVWFGATRVIFLRNEAPAPSHGAAIDHFGLSVYDVDAQLKVLDGSGARLVSPPSDVPGLHRSAFVEDPWGTRIELLHDPEHTGFHHVQLQVPDPVAARRWYVRRFGGRDARFKDRLAGVQYGDVWLFIERAADAVPSRGHAIDHVGWRMPDLLAKAGQLKELGLAFTTEPQPGPPGAFSPVLMSFAEDPWGVKIELLQRGGE